jgi:hypothetical protein
MGCVFVAIHHMSAVEVLDQAGHSLGGLQHLASHARRLALAAQSTGLCAPEFCYLIDHARTTMVGRLMLALATIKPQLVLLPLTFLLSWSIARRGPTNFIVELCCGARGASPGSGPGSAWLDRSFLAGGGGLPQRRFPVGICVSTSRSLDADLVHGSLIVIPAYWYYHGRQSHGQSECDLEVG